MSLFALTKNRITESNIRIELWFYGLMLDDINKDIVRMQTELLAFQFRYQSSLQHEEDSEVYETPQQGKNGILHKKFRELARLIHPDRAINAEDAKQRTELLAKASSAVENGNLELLIEMLNNHNPKQLSKIESLLALKFQIHILYSKRRILQNSDSWALYQLELEWADQGRDLIDYLKRHQT